MFRSSIRLFSSSTSSSSTSSSSVTSTSSTTSTIKKSSQAEAEEALRLIRKKKNNKIYAGLPLIGLVIVGSLFLTTFMETHMSIKDQKHGVSISERKFNLEEERVKMLKKLDIDNYSLSRIPKIDELSDPKIKKN